MIGLAELFIGTMHGYALDALQTHVAETFKYGVLDDIQTRLLIDRHSRESGLTTTDAIVNGQPQEAAPVCELAALHAGHEHPA